MSYEYDPIQDVGRLPEKLVPNEHIQEMCALGEQFQNSDERHERNRALAKEMRAGREARADLESGQVEPERIQSLETVAEQGDQARNQLLMNSLPLIRFWAYGKIAANFLVTEQPAQNKFQQLETVPAADEDDLWQNLVLGVYEKGLDRWCPESGYSLSTLLYRVMPRHYLDLLVKNRPIKTGASVIESAMYQEYKFNVRGIVTPEGEALEGQAFNDQLAALPKVEPIHWIEDRYDDELADKTMPALIPAVDVPYTQSTDHLKASLELEPFLGQLNTQEREVIELHFGLMGGKPHTYEEIGKIQDVTKQRIHQVVTKAFEKMRKQLPADLPKPEQRESTEAKGTPLSVRRQEFIDQMEGADRLKLFIDTLRAYKELVRPEIGNSYVPPSVIYSIAKLPKRSIVEQPRSNPEENMTYVLINMFSDEAGRTAWSVLNEDLEAYTVKKIEEFLKASSPTVQSLVDKLLTDAVMKRCMSYIEKHQKYCPTSPVGSPWLDSTSADQRTPDQDQPADPELGD